MASMTEVASATAKIRESGRSRNGSDRTTTGPSAGQSNMFTRLHSLLPSAISSKNPTDISVLQATSQSSMNPESDVPKPTRPAPRPLKVRIVTWNMHETLPKGNLEDLLGTVAPYVPYPEGETDKFRIPNMTLEDCHPYHLVVVAGQECPTVSGIPMGITAGLRGKEKDKHKDTTNGSAAIDSQHPNGHGPASGWSWILESWFCRGAGEKDNEYETTLASEVYDSQATDELPSDQGQECPEGVQSTEDRKDRKDKSKVKKRKHCSKNLKVGPYELLAKDRLMGIYVAVFIYRDLKPLVRGISKAAVTAGLIGGRVGNKGAAGISINLDGTTLLFVNAHLAAHEERVMDRVANMTKIKSQMHVDDYLNPNDPRFMAEDLMDRFDYTFVFGDLNFRLDITRKHADWLISRQAYDQALAFDQLRNVMEQGKAFVGFREGDINFPPTFKYDVFRSLKRDKSRMSKENSKGHAYYKRWRAHVSNQSLSRLDEQNDQAPAAVTEANSGEVGEAEEKAANTFTDNEDSGSIISAAVTATSTRSRPTENGDEDEDDVYYAQPLISRADCKPRTKNARITAVHKPFLRKAALKAKDKWLALISAPKKDNLKPFYFVRKASRAKRSSAAVSATTMPQLGRSTSGTSRAAFEETQAASAIELSQNDNADASVLRHASSKRSGKSNKSTGAVSEPESTKTADVDDRKGVYDSSSKQRVPSWCDRILWKSTVKPEPDPEEEVSDIRLGFGPRFLQFVSQPFRSRGRSSTGSSTQLINSPPIEPNRTVSLPPPNIRRPSTAPPGSGFATPLSSPTYSPPSTSLGKTATYAEGQSLADLVHQRRWLRTKGSLTKLTKSKSVEPETYAPKGPLDPRTGLRRGRSFSAQVPISRPFTLDREASGSQNHDLTGTTSIPTPNNTSTNTLFPRRFFPFFYRDSENSSAASETQPASRSLSTTTTPKYRKGDVVVLGYRTLDDPAMRKLEGRSDHRPVIGSYALFI